jgi:nucleotide-binding universal stress UspA family protein
MTTNIRNILYCTDLSQNATHAFKYAVTLAKMTSADVHILHVVEELSSDAKVTLQAYVMNDNLRHKALDERAAQAKTYLNKRIDDFWSDADADERAVKDQIKSINVVEAYPAEQILKSAIDKDCDLVVMGAHEKGLSHNFLGGVAKSVLRRSRIPTLVVPLP